MKLSLLTLIWREGRLLCTRDIFDHFSFLCRSYVWTLHVLDQIDAVGSFLVVWAVKLLM